MNAKGFTLLETTLYLALFAFLLGSLLPVAHQLIRSADRQRFASEARDEASLIGQMLRVTIFSASQVSVPDLQTLVVRTVEGSTLTYASGVGVITVKKDDEPPIKLNLDAYTVTDANFSLLQRDGSEAVVTRFSIGTVPYEFRHALPRRGSFPSSCQPL